MATPQTLPSLHHVHLVRGAQPTAPEEHLDTEAGEALHRIVRGDPSLDRSDVVRHALQILGRRRRNAGETIVGCCPDGVRDLGGLQQGLRGDTAVMEAISPHSALFQQSDPGAQEGADGGDRQSSGPTADDDEIVSFHAALL
jgi:hypothetical protein